MTAIRDLLAAYALGALEPEEVELVERAVAADPALAAEVDALVEASVQLAIALPGPAPAPAQRDRLLAAVVAEAEPAPTRFARFVGRITELFDVTVERARELLGLVDDPGAWQPGPAPGTWLIHFRAGPAYAGADTGFVKLDPGARFPRHHHLGEEIAVVLDGVAHDSAVGSLQPGDEPTCGADSYHEFRAIGDRPLVVVVRVFGVEFDVDPPA